MTFDSIAQFSQVRSPATLVMNIALVIIVFLALSGRATATLPKAHAGDDAVSIVPGFKTSIVGETEPEKRRSWRLILIKVTFSSGPGGGAVSVSCEGCRGKLGEPTNSPGKSEYHTSLVVTTRSRLAIYLSHPGWLGRFKEYTLRPRLRSHRLLSTGCLAIDVLTPVPCSHQQRYAYAGPGIALPATCPFSCYAVTQTTGYQEVADRSGHVSVIRNEGELVGWQLHLGRPAPNQVEYFDRLFGVPSAAITVLRPLAPSGISYDVVAQSPTVSLRPHFGTVVTFWLHDPIPVKTDDLVALTVPTWAPSLTLIAGGGDRWRASRVLGQCTETVQSAFQLVGSIAEFPCLYREADLNYDAILLP